MSFVNIKAAEQTKYKCLLTSKTKKREKEKECAHSNMNQVQTQHSNFIINFLSVSKVSDCVDFETY